MLIENAKSQSRCAIPIYISHIEDLAKFTGDLRVGTNEFRPNTRRTQIGAHSEICNGSDHRDRSGDVVEDTVRTRLGVGQSDEDQGRDEHHSTNSLYRQSANFSDMT